MCCCMSCTFFGVRCCVQVRDRQAELRVEVCADLCVQLGVGARM